VLPGIGLDLVSSTRAEPPSGGDVAETATRRPKSTLERDTEEALIREREETAMRTRSVAIATAVALAAAATTASTAIGGHAAIRNGRIALWAGTSGYPQVFTIRPSGKGLKQVTHLQFQESQVPGVAKPTWSPDGSTIAFESDYQHTPDHYVSVFTIRADGSHLTRLPISVGAYTGAPAYSPDGTQISFDRDVGPAAPTDHGIWIANADGSSPRRVTTGIATSGAFDTNSRWSPDGKWLVFTRVMNDDRSAIFKVRIDGTALKQLTAWRLSADNASWSPDGSKLLFNTYHEPQPRKDANVFTMRPDGTHVVALTHLKHGDGQAYAGSWSPDGKWIVFHKDAVVDELFIMDARGHHVRRLTHIARARLVHGGSWGTAP
jgi:Tol biopolymer transport system component